VAIVIEHVNYTLIRIVAADSIPGSIQHPHKLLTKQDTSHKDNNIEISPA